MDEALTPSAATLSARDAADFIREKSTAVTQVINDFTQNTFTTRGGRLGSGMGLLLEGLWGYNNSKALVEHGIEIAWIADDMYNDYAVVNGSADWDPITQEGELFRIEAKSMNLGADESKAHFAELHDKIGENDLLLVMTWGWEPDSSGKRVWPKISEILLERARPIAELRDSLHLARGGSFVNRNFCPDGCVPNLCQHHGEPLNSSGKRERLSGPESCRPSARVSFAANFGGLFRMIGTSSEAARQTLAQIRRENSVADHYVSFVNRSRRRMSSAT